MVDYPDKCVIGRSEGEVDENGDEIMTERYNGECLLQISGQTRYDGFQFEHEPVLFIPVNNIMFDVNDEVVVTTWNGRKMTYTIKDWEAIQDNDFEELNDTCIWLKDGTA